MDAWLELPQDLSEDDDAQAHRNEREERMRAAFLRARDTYDAKRDTQAWFMDGLTYEVLADCAMDIKMTQRIQMCIVYLYYQGEVDEAYAWSLRLLHRMHVLDGEVAWEDGMPHVYAPQLDKMAQSMSSSAVARETLDTALRCLLKMDAGRARSAPALIAAAYDRVHLDASAYRGVDTDSEKRRQCLWTPMPGMAITLGHVCASMKYTRCSVETFALVAGLRGAQWYLCTAMSRALANYAEQQKSRRAALEVLAQATMVCALQSCPPTRRTCLAQEFLNGEHLPKNLCTPTTCTLDEINALLSWDGLSVEAAAGILYALRKRGGALALSARLPTFTRMAQAFVDGTSSTWISANDESSEKTFSSVRTL